MTPNYIETLNEINTKIKAPNMKLTNQEFNTSNFMVYFVENNLHYLDCIKPKIRELLVFLPPA